MSILTGWYTATLRSGDAKCIIGPSGKRYGHEVSALPLDLVHGPARCCVSCTFAWTTLIPNWLDHGGEYIYQGAAILIFDGMYPGTLEMELVCFASNIPFLASQIHRILTDSCGRCSQVTLILTHVPKVSCTVLPDVTILLVCIFCPAATFLAQGREYNQVLVQSCFRSFVLDSLQSHWTLVRRAYLKKKTLRAPFRALIPTSVVLTPIGFGPVYR